LTIAIIVWVGARAFGVELPVELPDGLARTIEQSGKQALVGQLY